MKYSELVEDYLLDWSEVDSFIQHATPIITNELKDTRELWFQGYFRPKKTEDKRVFLIYDRTILLAIRWQELDKRVVCLKEVLLNSDIEINRNECVELVRVATHLGYFRELVIEESDCNPSWKYWLKQAGAVTLSHRLTLSSQYTEGLVLSGGGAKGAYQIGVWQAIEEHARQFPVITGTSVGALNGALIMQGDFDVAKKMWEDIATNKILDFPVNDELDSYDTNHLVENIQLFIKSALMNKGVSTEPLKKMIETLLSVEKIKANPSRFYICTTRLKMMSEKVIDIKEQSNEDVYLWLLASSSFFPAMAATTIEQEPYIDGGYRNNIPIDVALAKGANSLLIVDIEGPGVTKTHKISPTVPIIYLKSYWSLGTVLLFDHERSKWNIKLGYLEMKKKLGELSGYLYSFNYDEQQQPLRAMNYRLLPRVFSSEQIKNISNDALDGIIKKIRKLSNDRVSVHTWLVVLMELLAKYLGVSPIHVYSYDAFIEEIIKEYHASIEEKSPTTSDMLLSLGEHLSAYFGSTPLISERAQLVLLTDLFLQEKISTDTYKKIAMINEPVLLMAQMLSCFIKERG
ncbi:patatin-like phospholipase family protein [Vagococcus xieshaowenii]|uniref:Patatin-like phospholipase family protein n=1 Tax=Vagococcus xieshaowenii TaxID=2562451 RepID=A0AAJ5EDE7_9ENTE|nr:patatin-like phospholipase family protein [Vagococcus xieshaowenii]QCA28940.1 patatin-like phospholipase family protein [Vagococcus xieshaowenii]TFZ39248.1 patatin-like phospholipase family protein [Vagococcus xieshaowenii]